MTPYDLVTLEAAAERVKAPPNEAELPSLITAVSRAMARHLRYELHRRTGVVETVASNGGAYLFLRGGGLQRIEEVRIGGSIVDDTLYHLEDTKAGRIVHRRGAWPFTGASSGGVNSTPLHSYDTGEIVVKYTAGYVTPGQAALNPAAGQPRHEAALAVVSLPEDIQEAALVTVVSWFRKLGRDPDVTNRAIGDGSVSYGADSLRGGKPALPLPAVELLRSYRKPVAGGAA
jgi:hypothetical protein